MLAVLDDIAGSVALLALVVATVALLVALAAIRRRVPPPVVREPEPAAHAVRAIAPSGEPGERLEALTAAVERLREQVNAAETDRRHAIQHVGLVRFNPFDDTGGNQSFSLALLDENADGVVLSSLHTRAATRVYVKAILRGRSEAPLSEEELAALRDAGLQV